jgi:hypothetical protein
MSVKRLGLGAGLIVLVVALVAVSGSLSDPETTYASFEEGMGEWSIDAHVWCYDDPDPCDWDWDAERRPGVAYERAWGILVEQAGIHDSGAVWVERPLATPSGEHVEVSFWVFSPYMTQTSPWQVRAYVGEEDPDREFDLDPVGQTGRVPGWYRYCHAEPAPDADRIWVAGGVRVAFETGTRVHALDHVSVRGVDADEACEPPGEACQWVGEPCSVRREICQRTVCATPAAAGSPALTPVND